MVERERETIVHTDGGERRSSGGTLLAVVLLIAILAVLYVLFGQQLLNGGGDTDTIKADINIDAPAGGGGTGK